MPITYRDLTTLEEFARVVDLERKIWGPGYDEVVPVPILAVTVKRGGILIGAFDDSRAAGAGPPSEPGQAPAPDLDRMIGFVYSLAGIKHGKPTQWSHMLGVVDAFRSAGVGRELKLLQRQRTLAMGLDLIEWTYDPMQAMNAHLNFAKLGVVVEEYEENIYGESSSLLHRGTPTDRFVAEWRLREPHVARRIAAIGTPTVRDRSVTSAPIVNPSALVGEWLAPGDGNLSLDERRIIVEIPVGFGEMQQRDPARALEWRLKSRAIFQTYLSRGYRVVDFFLSREARRGHYLLATR